MMEQVALAVWTRGYQHAVFRITGHVSREYRCSEVVCDRFLEEGEVPTYEQVDGTATESASAVRLDEDST
jgi:hypothetical protein